MVYTLKELQGFTKLYEEWGYTIKNEVLLSYMKNKMCGLYVEVNSKNLNTAIYNLLNTGKFLNYSEPSFYSSLKMGINQLLR